MKTLFGFIIFFVIVFILMKIGFWINGRFFEEGSFLNNLILLMLFIYPISFGILYDLSGKQNDNGIEMNIKNIFQFVFVYGTIFTIVFGFIGGVFF